MDNRTRNLMAPAAAWALAAFAVPVLSACTGRTTDNMQPKGQTVEVRVVNPDPDPLAPIAETDTITTQQ